MTTHTPPARRSVRRTAARVSVVAGALVSTMSTLVLAAGPASADVPENWSDPADVSALQALVLLVGVPLLLIALITLAVYVPALARGEKLAPGAAPIDDEWFGGPRTGTKELASSRPAARADSPEERGTGGASGSW